MAFDGRAVVVQLGRVNDPVNTGPEIGALVVSVGWTWSSRAAFWLLPAVAVPSILGVMAPRGVDVPPPTAEMTPPAVTVIAVPSGWTTPACAAGAVPTPRF